MVYGPGREKPPNGVRLISVKTANEMLLAVKNEMKKKFDIVIMAAAPSDYTPEKPSSIKIKSTSKKMTVTLNRVPKIIDQVKKIQKDVFLVGFKALARVTKKELEKEARKKMRECGADLMVANDIGSPRYRKNPENNEILIVGSKRTLSSGWKKKEKIVKLIRKEIENRIEKS
jgi:phosphopantothenoylcysteine decarboxylase/phosphopantothenate--cysteine ligase